MTFKAEFLLESKLKFSLENEIVPLTKYLQHDGCNKSAKSTIPDLFQFRGDLNVIIGCPSVFILAIFE